MSSAVRRVCLHHLEMSLFLPFRNVTPRWSGSGGGRARSLGAAQRPTAARSNVFETAPVLFYRVALD